MPTVSVTTTAEFLAHVPAILGFTPAESIVIVPFAGSRSLGALRADLPADDKTNGDIVASTLIGLLCRLDSLDAFSVVIYTDNDVDQAAYTSLVKHLHHKGDACGMEVLHAVCTSSTHKDHWWAYPIPTPEAARAARV